MHKVRLFTGYMLGLGFLADGADPNQHEEKMHINHPVNIITWRHKCYVNQALSLIFKMILNMGSKPLTQLHCIRKDAKEALSQVTS